MNERDLISTQTIKQVSEGGDRVRADLKATASAQDQLAASSTNLASATETSARRQTSAAAAFNALQTKIDPASRALAELDRAQRTVTRALDQGVTSQSRANEVLAMYATRASAAAAAANTAAVAEENRRRAQSNTSVNQGQGFNPASANTATYAAQFEAAAHAQDMMAASATKLRAAINPLEAEQGRLASEMKVYKQALDAGKISEAEFSAAHAMAGKRLSDFAQNLKVAGTAGRVMSGEMTNLGFQLNDVVTGLALGQSPFMILGQQGGQIVQIFANSKSSIADFAKSSVGWFTSLFTVGRFAFGGVAAAVGTAVFAMHEFAESQRLAGQALIGVGQRTGTTVAQINEFAKANATVTGLSVDQARDLAVEFTKTGNISIAGLKGLGDAVHGYSILTGKDATEATKDLAQSLGGDLVKAAEKLNSTYGFLDAKSRDYIRTLELQGGRTQAIQFIVDAMAKDNQKAADSLSFVSKAWDAVANAASRAKNIVGSANLKDTLPAGGIGGAEGLTMAAPQNQTIPQAVIPDAERLGAVVKLLQDWSLAADNVTRATIPQITQVEALQKAEVDLIAARNAKEFLGQSADPQNEAALTAIRNQIAALQEAQGQAARYNQQVAAISQAWGNVGQSVALQLQSMQNVLPVAQAWTNATRMRAQEEATYLSLIQQGRTEEEASAVAAKEYQLSKAAAVASAQQLVQSSADNLEKIRAAGTGMEGVVDASIAYRDAIQGGATAMQANIIAANTLEASMLRVAQASMQAQQSQIDAANGTTNGILTTKDMGSSFFAPTENKQSGSFVIPTHTIDLGDGATVTVSSGVQGIGMLAGAGVAPTVVSRTPVSASKIADRYVSHGDYAGGISAIMKSGADVNEKISSVDELTQVMNNMTSDKGAQASNLRSELDWLSTLPQTIARDQKIVSLTQSIDQLKDSTDSLTSVNQDLLSPYYSQDPRTSRIGFRSQGMAEGGFVVPGTPSANDNMLATFPVASGENILYVDPQFAKRGMGGGSSSVINITNNNIIAGGVNKDEFGRTAYQTAQTTAKVVRAAMQ